MSGEQNGWSAKDQVAALNCGPLRAALPIDRPQEGIGGISWNARPLADVNLFRIANELLLVDHHIRGCDLVASYRQTKGSSTTPQVYWRSVRHSRSAACGIEVVLSVQTDLLDSSPLSIVWSNLPCMELLHSDAMDATAFEPVSLVHGRAIIGANAGTFHLLVARLHDGHCSYAQLVHPADFELLEIDHGVRIRTPIFHQHLEKGVIRRGRICGWFMPAENDLQTAVELARQFVDEPLPLTT